MSQLGTEPRPMGKADPAAATRLSVTVASVVHMLYERHVGVRHSRDEGP